MKFVSLFTGIGGIDLGLERAGWECVAQVENDPWCNRVLEKHWPATPRWKDIHDLSPTDLPHCDAVVGGFPCQPVSLAGTRAAQDDPRWLWPEFFRIVRHVRPRYVIVENVPGLASAGMGDVLGDLASIGYDAEWQSIPAAAVGAPHLRWRIFIVAYPNGGGRRRGTNHLEGQTVPDEPQRRGPGNEPKVLAYPGSAGRQQNTGSAHGDEGPNEGRTPQDTDIAPSRSQRDRAGTLADTDSRRRQIVGEPQHTRLESPPRDQPDRRSPGGWRNGPHLADTEVDTVRPGLRESEPARQRSRRPSDSSSSREPWAVEPDVGRVAHGIPRRVDRLRGLGNAVVPQVAEWVAQRINKQVAGPETRNRRLLGSPITNKRNPEDSPK